MVMIIPIPRTNIRLADKRGKIQVAKIAVKTGPITTPKEKTA